MVFEDVEMVPFQIGGAVAKEAHGLLLADVFGDSELGAFLDPDMHFARGSVELATMLRV